MGGSAFDVRRIHVVCKTQRIIPSLAKADFGGRKPSYIQEASQKPGHAALLSGG